MPNHFNKRHQLTMYELTYEEIPQKNAKGPEPKYPFQAMEVGQSFLEPDLMRSGAIRAAAAYHSRPKVRDGEPIVPKRFSVRKTEQGFRVWRIA